MHNTMFPFSAIVGHSFTKQALVLLAIEPRLRGVLISSGSGSGKSLLIQAFSSIFLEVCQQNGKVKNASIVKVPLGVTEDRLIGGLDIKSEHTRTSLPYSRGLLSKADKGILAVDDNNLMQDSSICHIASAIDAGFIRIEREGLSTVNPAGFSLIGTYNPLEGMPSKIIQSRIGMIVDDSGLSSLKDRTEVLQRALVFDLNPKEILTNYLFKDSEIINKIKAAQCQLPKVCFPSQMIQQLITISSQLQLEGQNPEFFAMVAARANAALAARTIVSEEDLEIGIQLALIPRTKIESQNKEKRQCPKPDSKELKQSDSVKNTSDPENLISSDRSSKSENILEEQHSLPDSVANSEDDFKKQIPALPSELPHNLMNITEHKKGRFRFGKRSENSSHFRGRRFRASLHPEGNRAICWGATLRAAAPLQNFRNKKKNHRISDRKNLLRNIVPQKMSIKIEDLHFHRFRGKTGLLFIFLVDASGSMAINRMAQAKGALTKLLEQAYVFRDQVSLIQCRGKSAQILLSPTRSIQRAKNLVDTLPAAGSTPLASGLLKALNLFRTAQLRNCPQPVLFILTDGRANQLASSLSVNQDLNSFAIQKELEKIGVVFKQENLPMAVIDTRPYFLMGTEGKTFAEWIGARYLQLPHNDRRSLFQAVNNFAREIRIDRSTF